MRKLYRGKYQDVFVSLNTPDTTEEQGAVQAAEATVSSEATVITEAPVINENDFSEVEEQVEADFDIRLQDAFEFLESLEDASVDLVFADPPYFLSNGGTTCHSGKRVSVDKGDWDKTMGPEANHDFFMRWLKECKRIMKPSGTIVVSGTYHCIYSIGYAMQKLGMHVLNDICWYKPNAAPNLAGRQFAAKHETLIWAAPQKFKTLQHTYNYKDMKGKNIVKECACGAIARGKANFCQACGKHLSDDTTSVRQPTAFWEIPTPAKREKIRGKHSTQKPVKLLKYVIESVTKPGDLVIDPFMGGGTTAVACKLLGRRFKGSDNDKVSVDLTVLRVLHAKEDLGSMLDD